MSELIKSYAAYNNNTPLAPFAFNQKKMTDKDVMIDILYCGVCHSDIHMSRNEWNWTRYPIVPGHEIVGKVVQVGKKAKKYKLGDIVGVGVYVGACEVCPECKSGNSHYCDQFEGTYNDIPKNSKQPNYGGYSKQIVVNENYVLKVNKKLPLHAVAPLLCAGITTYSPLKYWKVRKGHKVAVVGLGGLGHLAVKFAKAMGATVTVCSTSISKKKDAQKLGATNFLISTEKDFFTKNRNKFDFIVDTLGGQHDYNSYINLLGLNGVYICLSFPQQEIRLSSPFTLIEKRRTVTASKIGSIKETQEMLDFCAKHKIVSDVELISIQKINEAFERMIKGDVKYRFVIDLSSLN
ncbi:MAG: NAD(P)-dependent alcohol dehydrogenase [Phycisphaerales bacterium]|nr:NAD(P)-dependent alcohol dehydrogenase [Phycisphaerales bacterium]